jgi:hypothetical protein
VFGISRGSFAEYAAVREDKLSGKPGNLAFDQAAAVACRPDAVAVDYLADGRRRDTDERGDLGCCQRVPGRVMWRAWDGVSGEKEKPSGNADRQRRTTPDAIPWLHFHARAVVMTSSRRLLASSP